MPRTSLQRLEIRAMANHADTSLVSLAFLFALTAATAILIKLTINRPAFHKPVRHNDSPPVYLLPGRILSGPPARAESFKLRIAKKRQEHTSTL